MKTAMLIIILTLDGQGKAAFVDHIGMASIEVCEAAAEAVRAELAEKSPFSMVRDTVVCVHDE